MIDQQISHYKILRLLGKGGMACVYLAEQLGLRRQVALKILHPHLAADEIIVERFLREARIAANLHHQHIVTIYDVGEVNGVYYIAMRYIEGESFGQLLRREGPLEPGRALDVLAQVAEALDFAHTHGVLHRDVKPANVMVEPGDVLTLTDFGIARAGHQSGLTAAHTVIGTPAYMSPEQARGAPVDQRSDLYALGIMLYEALGGRPPFQADSTTALLFMHVNQPPPPLSEIRPELPRGLSDVVSRALAKNPDDRYQSAHDLIAAARAALSTWQEMPDEGATSLVTPDQLTAQPRTPLPLMPPPSMPWPSDAPAPATPAPATPWPPAPPAASQPVAPWPPTYTAQASGYTPQPQAYAPRVRAQASTPVPASAATGTPVATPTPPPVAPPPATSYPQAGQYVQPAGLLEQRAPAFATYDLSATSPAPRTLPTMLVAALVVAAVLLLVVGAFVAGQADLFNRQAPAATPTAAVAVMPPADVPPAEPTPGQLAAQPSATSVPAPRNLPPAQAAPAQAVPTQVPATPIPPAAVPTPGARARVGQAQDTVAAGDFPTALEQLELLRRDPAVQADRALATMVDRTLADVHIAYGEQLLLEDNHDDSYAQFSAALVLRPNDGRALDGQKRVLLAKNYAIMEATLDSDDDVAINALEEIMRIDAGYRDARDRLHALLIRKADHLLAEGDMDSAYPFLMRALSVVPGSPEAMQRLKPYTPTPLPPAPSQRTAPTPAPDPEPPEPDAAPTPFTPAGRPV